MQKTNLIVLLVKDERIQRALRRARANLIKPFTAAEFLIRVGALAMASFEAGGSSK